MMTGTEERPAAGPFSRPVPVGTIPATGLVIEVKADQSERAALAAEFGLAAIGQLEGAFTLTPRSRGRIAVEGQMRAAFEPICVVTLEPFPDERSEDVALVFAEAPESGAEGEEPPDPIVAGMIDLGAVTAEFLALSLDPYPRKPGARFDFDSGDAEIESPFAVLKARKPGERP